MAYPTLAELLPQIEAAHDLTTLNDLRIKFLGKKGIITELMAQIAAEPKEMRKSFGQSINTLKQGLEAAIKARHEYLEQAAITARLAQEYVDVTLPGRGLDVGQIHPLSKVIKDVRSIMRKLGFTEAFGPEIEDEWHNFSALNIPELHPARQMHDTFYIAQEGEESKLLRTHTSTVQIRHMSHNPPPHKVFSIGKVYRSDYDATHTPMFHQAEGLLIDKEITLCNLKWCLERFLSMFFEVDSAPVRFRPSYFPFTEPSFEVDVRCDRSQKGEIKIGVGNDWLEILGCGMVHENVLQNVGLDAEYQGFAFGIGLERLAMLKYGIGDLRSFFQGDARWLKHYGFSGNYS